MKNSRNSDSRLVYSTDAGRIAEPTTQTPIIPDTNNKIKLKRETKKRGGKTAIVIEGCPTSIQTQTLKQLKNLCACGGTIKASHIEIQGDHVMKIRAYFEQLNFVVVQSGK